MTTIHTRRFYTNGGKWHRTYGCSGRGESPISQDLTQEEVAVLKRFNRLCHRCCNEFIESAL